MPEIKTYRAASFEEALEHIRRELGPEALIVSSREIRPRRFWPLKPADSQIEVTARLTPELELAPAFVPTSAWKANSIPQSATLAEIDRRLENIDEILSLVHDVVESQSRETRPRNR